MHAYRKDTPDRPELVRIIADALTAARDYLEREEAEYLALEAVRALELAGVLMWWRHPEAT